MELEIRGSSSTLDSKVMARRFLPSTNSKTSLRENCSG